MRTGHAISLPIPQASPEAEPPSAASAPPEEIPEGELTGLTRPPGVRAQTRRFEGRWYSTPSVPDQELQYPGTVHRGAFVTQVLWLDKSEDASLYSQLMSGRLADDTTVEVGVLDRQFVAERSTWTVLAVYRPLYFQAPFSS